MTGKVILTGYGYSVYTRSVRMALIAKDVPFAYHECNPFDPDQRANLCGKHPFGRVPVLEHRGVTLYETRALLHYIDEVFEGPPLFPGPPLRRARMRQAMGIADNYAYWPLIRQAFSHAVFLPLSGETGDRAEIEAGLVAAPRVLKELDEIAQELWLGAEEIDLAECLLWPMIDYFCELREAPDLIADHGGLLRWIAKMRACRTAQATRPDLVNMPCD